LRETVENFSNMGYRVDPLLNMFEGDLKKLEVAVSELEDHVIILQDLEERLNNVDPSGREERIEHARTLLYDPERIAEAIDEVEALERPQ
jgi:hypothetical protein